jgi:hypothetical protein
VRASIFGPGGVKPTAVRPDDNADGGQDDEGDALVVPGFCSSASVGPGVDDVVLQSGGGSGFGGGIGWKWLMAHAGGRPNDPSISAVAAPDRVVDNKAKIQLIGGAVADTKAVDVRQDLGVGVASGVMAQVELARPIDTDSE